jgi:hypothetical protein
MFLDGFRETTGFPGPIYTDPSLAVFEAAGLRRGLLATVGPRAALAALGSLTRGFRPGRTQGDPLQQGGVLVVTPAGEITWRHVSRFAGDNASPAEVLAGLRAAG